MSAISLFATSSELTYLHNQLRAEADLKGGARGSSPPTSLISMDTHKAPSIFWMKESRRRGEEEDERGDEPLLYVWARFATDFVHIFCPLDVCILDIFSSPVY